MYLKHLSLTNYRNYARLEIDLQARIHVFQGENAQGKTNLLEAVYYLATTRSPLASSDRQLIAWAAEREVIPHSYINGAFVRADGEHTIEITLVVEREPNGPAEAASLRRQVCLDGTPRRAIDIVGKLNVVLFLPEDIILVSGAPGERRRYLDVTLCQIDPVYCRTLSRYNRVMSQRNALLRQIRESRASAGELDYWDEQLVDLGAYVLSRRLWALDELGVKVAEMHPALTGGQEQLALVYQSSIAAGAPHPGPLPEGEGQVRVLQDSFRSALEHARGEEIARAVTVVGPHRDDLRFLVNGADMTIYGSRGQQRTVALTLKLAEVTLMEEQTGEMPVLLLDDVISELDQHRCQYLLQAVQRAQQVLITTTDLHFYALDFLASAALWQVAAGAVAPTGTGEGEVPCMRC